MLPTDERSMLTAALRSYLEDLRETGVEELPLGLTAVKPGNRSEAPAAAASSGKETLAEIRADIGDCQRCTLCAERTQIVFGCGTPSAKVLFIGTAPGREEDIQGEPFVGEAGQLLTKMIVAMHLNRQEVYLCNVLKCRPPLDRDPGSDEIACCSQFLFRQVQAIAPQVIITLGAFAAQTLLGNNEPLEKLRGSYHDCHGVPVMPTFHPSLLIRSPEKKREAWSDLQQVMKFLL